MHRHQVPSHVGRVLMTYGHEVSYRLVKHGSDYILRCDDRQLRMRHVVVS